MGLIEDVGSGPVGLDTAVFIYFVEEHAEFLPLVEPLFAGVDAGRWPAVTSSLTLLETLVVPYRAHDAALADRYEALLSRSRGLHLVDLDRSLLRAAAHLRATLPVKTPDALQLAAALRKPLELIQKTANRAAELTQQLLTFSRRQILQPRLLDLTGVVDAMAGMLQRLIGEDVELVLRTQRPIGLVNADPGRVSQIVMNLAVNARDAMPRGGRLTIETRDVDLEGTAARDAGLPPGPYVMLAVHDTGSGMDASTLGRIFEPFFTTKAVGQGSGLGLSMVYGIVQQSGGAIDVDSAPGRGSTFRIFLPRVAGDTRTDAAAGGPVARPRGSETILIAEDEDELRELAREILEHQGFRVLAAREGAEAVRVAEQHAGRIHLLLTDAVMPGMSGRVLAEYLGPRRRDMRVLFMSGYTDDAMIRHGVSSAGLFLQKPFTPDTLVQTVRAALDQPETASGAERGSETRT